MRGINNPAPRSNLWPLSNLIILIGVTLYVVATSLL